MRALLRRLDRLRRGPVGERVRRRLAEFRRLARKGEEDWFSELCYCLLTANSAAAKSWAIQREMGFEGFYAWPESEVVRCIRRHNHRFHNTKARRIVEARGLFGIRERLRRMVSARGVLAARDWLQENVKGYGYKEASHFIRNVGYEGVAILDRHVVSVMAENGLLRRSPKALNRKSYLALERKFASLAREAKMSMAELDLDLWYLKAGDVLK